MTVHPNLQLLRDQFVAMERLDKEALAALFTTDVRWWAPISAEQRGLASRPLEGAATVVEMMTTLLPQLYGPEATWTIEHVIADDQTGAVHVELATTLAGSGQPYRNAYAFFYRFESGRIAEVWEYTDTYYAFGRFEEAAANQTSAPLSQ